MYRVAINGPNPAGFSAVREEGKHLYREPCTRSANPVFIYMRLSRAFFEV